MIVAMIIAVGGEVVLMVYTIYFALRELLAKKKEEENQEVDILLTESNSSTMDVELEPIAARVKVHDKAVVGGKV